MSHAWWITDLCDCKWSGVIPQEKWSAWNSRSVYQSSPLHLSYPWQTRKQILKRSISSVSDVAFRIYQLLCPFPWSHHTFLSQQIQNYQYTYSPFFILMVFYETGGESPTDYIYIRKKQKVLVYKKTHETKKKEIKKIMKVTSGSLSMCSLNLGSLSLL